MTDEKLSPPLPPQRLTDAELLAKWRSERSGSGRWTRHHYGRSMGIIPSQAEITRSNAAAKRRKKR